ncbi:MAG: glycosyltransferase [Deltaproteobacteria bacterium]|nr:glycosyltransferase [Deltaproteobacteria bacterium]
MKIAHIGWLISSHLRRRAEALARRGLDTLVITDQIPNNYDGRSKGLKIAVLPESFRTDPLSLVSWVEEQLGANNIQLLHIHSTHFPASLGFFCSKVPRIISIWDFFSSWDCVSPLFHTVILKELFNGSISEHVSFSSKVVLDEWLKRGFPEQRAHWHSWGVDLEVFHPIQDASDIQNLKLSLGILPDEKVIFSPRTPSLPANNDLLLKAIPIVNKSVKVRCIITGHSIPQETRYLEQLMKQEDIRSKIIFLDTIQDERKLSLLYQMASVVVSLHSSDHNPATVLEAMASGAVMVVNESNSVEYWIKHNENGFVVKTRDLPGLITTLIQALTLPRKQKQLWQHHNVRKIHREANFEKTLVQVISDYYRIIKEPRACRSIIHEPFYHGLLFDIMNQHTLALRAYQKARSSGFRHHFLEELIQEKKDYLNRAADAASFHRRRASKEIIEICAKPRSRWVEAIQRLPYPKSLFRHDYIAGLFSLVKENRIDDYLYFIKLISNHFKTCEVQWIAETVNWFGCKWKLWDFCADLLLNYQEGGTSLAIYALKTAEALGEQNSRWEPLLSRVLDWTNSSIDAIHPELDRVYRKEVRDTCLRMKRIPVQAIYGQRESK